MRVVTFAIGGLWLAAHAGATQPTYKGPVSTLPSHFDAFLAPQNLRSSAPASDGSGISLFRKLEHDDLKITGFVASRNAQDAADYRVYFGLGYKTQLGDLAKVTSRAFYGTGTYDGMNPNGASLPEDVRASGELPGQWVGADWKLESQLSAGHTFLAGMEYRERLGFELVHLNELMGRPGTLDDAQAERKVGIVTTNKVALSQDVALKVRMRYDQDTSVSGSSVEPRVELVYKPGQTSTLSAMFDQVSADDESDRTRNYELAYEKSLRQQNRVRLLARVSYAWQETTDCFAGAGNGSLGQRLTKVRLDFPIVPNRLSTSFELQHLDVVGQLTGDQGRDFYIGNLTLASGALSSNTRVSFGMHNLFGARQTGSGARLLSLIPPDGRSLRLDVTRKLQAAGLSRPCCRRGTSKRARKKP